MKNLALEKFSISGLNGEYNVDLEIVDNIKILVSENGYGKTTILKMLYLFLRQDKKIFNYDFENIKIKVDGVEYTFHKELLRILLNNDIMMDLENIDSEEIELFESNMLNTDKLNISEVVIFFLLYFCNENSDDPRGGIKLNKQYHKLAAYAKKTIEEVFHIYRIDSIKFDNIVLEQVNNKLFRRMQRIFKFI
ncbi:DUF2813 domain-containing protein [Acinetobacter nosocomialis]|uniref:DUF2813 domain-containing protein n=1 Tax=Acinetobacter nosocomialis TaxID=106654 RepID=UPI00124F3C9E|nr:DUF2813 domain-containing protein [Acinetobacter nosocomialis]